MPRCSEHRGTADPHFRRARAQPALRLRLPSPLASAVRVGRQHAVEVRALERPAWACGGRSTEPPGRRPLRRLRPVKSRRAVCRPLAGPDAAQLVRRNRARAVGLQPAFARLPEVHRPGLPRPCAAALASRARSNSWAAVADDLPPLRAALGVWARRAVARCAVQVPALPGPLRQPGHTNNASTLGTRDTRACGHHASLAGLRRERGSGIGTIRRPILQFHNCRHSRPAVPHLLRATRKSLLGAASRHAGRIGEMPSSTFTVTGGTDSLFSTEIAPIM